MTIPGIGRMISTAMIAAVGKGEAFDCGRDFAGWLGLVQAQYSTGGPNHPREDYQTRQQIPSHALRAGRKGDHNAAGSV